MSMEYVCGKMEYSSWRDTNDSITKRIEIKMDNPQMFTQTCESYLSCCVNQLQMVLLSIYRDHFSKCCRDEKTHIRNVQILNGSLEITT